MPTPEHASVSGKCVRWKFQRTYIKSSVKLTFREREFGLNEDDTSHLGSSRYCTAERLSGERLRETGSSEPDPGTTGIPCINDIDLPFNGQRHWLTVQTSVMATVDEPEIWEDLEKLNLNGLKPAPTPIVTPKPIKNTEYVNTSYSKSSLILGPRLWNVHLIIYLFLFNRRSEQQQVSLEEVDDALLEALKDSKERSTGESSITAGCSSMRLFSST